MNRWVIALLFGVLALGALAAAVMKQYTLARIITLALIGVVFLMWDRLAGK